MASQEELDREAAIKRYRQLLAEKDALAKEKAALAQNIAWVRSQLPAQDDVENPVGSDLLFLADYACDSRHVAVKVLASETNGLAAVIDLTVQQRMEKMSTVLWPSSCVLAEVVTHELHALCARGAPILELGCGTALPSIVAAALGAKVLATDAEIASADLVIAKNQHALGAAGGSIETACLTWGAPAPEKPWAAVLVADAIYEESSHVALAATLASAARVALLFGASTPPRILVAWQNRQPEVEARFFCQRLPQVGLQARELSLTNIPLSDKLRSCIRVMDVTMLDGPKPVDMGSIIESLEGMAL